MRFLTILILILITVSCDQKPLPPDMQAREDNYDDELALNRLNQDSTFIYDPVTEACWVYYDGVYEGSVVPISCKIAHKRMSKAMLEKLLNAEKELGHTIE